MAWDEILEHDVAKRILRAHLTAGRVAQAYLLAGPEGVGKRRLGLEWAKALNCAAGSAAPCDACPSCRQIGRQIHPDLHVIAPSGAAEHIGIEEVRRVLGRVTLRPFSARMQVALVERADRLTEEAANSLLKALEEPSSVTRFVLTTSEVSRCLPTVVSRCQLIRCRALSTRAVQQLLTEPLGIEQATAAAVAPLSGGSVSRALTLAQRWTQRQQLLARLSDPLLSAWVGPSLPETRQEVDELLESMVMWLRDLACEAVSATVPLVHAGHREAIARQARRVDLHHGLQVAFDCVALREAVAQFANPRLVAALAREQWLSLACVPSSRASHGAPGVTETARGRDGR